MENFIYAQLDEDSIAIGVSQLSGEVISPKMIRLEDYNISILGKKYVNGEWVEVDVEPEIEPIPKPTDGELAIMEALAVQYEDGLEKDLVNMEVQATIFETLLEIKEGGNI